MVTVHLNGRRRVKDRGDLRLKHDADEVHVVGDGKDLACEYGVRSPVRLAHEAKRS